LDALDVAWSMQIAFFQHRKKTLVYPSVSEKTNSGSGLTQQCLFPTFGCGPAPMNTARKAFQLLILFVLWVVLLWLQGLVSLQDVSVCPSLCGSERLCFCASLLCFVHWRPKYQQIWTVVMCSITANCFPSIYSLSIFIHVGCFIFLMYSACVEHVTLCARIYCERIEGLHAYACTQSSARTSVCLLVSRAESLCQSAFVALY
jgi:hypothetical protein